MGRKLTREETAELRALLIKRAAEGITPTEVAIEFGVTGDTARAHAKTIPDFKVRRLTDEIRMAQEGKLGFRATLPGYIIKSTSEQTGPSGELQRQWVKQTQAPGKEFEVPDGHVVKGVSSLQDSSGRVVAQWVKTKEGEVDVEDVIEAVKASIEEIRGTATLYPPPTESDPATFTVLPLVDWHVGLMAWAKESGENYDLKIARDVILKAMAQVIARSPSSQRAIVLGLGDMLHLDGYEPVTTRSKNQLDVDGRYPKVLDTAISMVRATIDMAAQRFEKVLVRIVPGNHDERATVALNASFKLLYENSDRIEFDPSPSRYWWHREGSVLLGATHGDTIRMKELPLVMAHDNPHDWAKSTYRRIYTGHIHHERTIEEGGVIVTSMRSPVAKDAWHSFRRWRSGRSVYADTYDVSGKMASSVKVNL